MLTVAKITAGAAVSYGEYLQGKTTATELGDYYLKDDERVEAPGRWVAGSGQLGLDPDRPVTGEQLHALMAVKRPDTGGPLRAAGASGQAVSALDATFSAPKSVSAVWALADRELRGRVEQAHETAIDRALHYATGQVPMIRRRVSDRQVVHEKPAGLLASSWRHTTARAVGQQVPDPQLHSHVLLHAAIRRDGRLVAIDSRSWLVHQREIGAAYRTELARELHTLGFDIRRGTGRGGRYFEIDQVPQPLLDRWSSRHHQVQAAIRQRITVQQRALEETISGGGPGASEAARQLELLRDTGQLSPKQDRLMAALTRNAKSPVTVAELDGEWRRAALREGLSRERVEVLRLGHTQALEPAANGDVLAALTDYDATFPAREARAIALERNAGAPIEDSLQLLKELRSSGEIQVLEGRAGTTREHRGRERQVVAVVGRLAADHTPGIPVGLVEGEIDRLDDELSVVGGRLSGEQRDAIRLACGERQLVVIEGQAGTGKSTTLTGIARAHQADHRQIIVTSTAAVAAERLANDLEHNGVQASAYSTVALQAAIHSGQLELGERTTVIHDEAALASTREQLRLMHAIEQSGARLIEVGDGRQNQPVGAGGLWKHVEHAARDADARVELTVNQRARDPADSRDQALFRTGEAEQAIRDYAQRGHIHFDDEQRRAEDLALEAAHEDRTAGETTVVIAQTSNEHLDELNARAQAIRLQAGQLGEPSLEIPGRPYRLHPGDQVQIRHTITDQNRHQLRNGTNAEILDVDERDGTLELRLADDTELQLDREQINPADLRLAYVQHPFPAQGRTTDTTHVIVADHATREGTYVALTRARQRTDIYAAEPLDAEPDTDRLQTLAERLSRSEPEIPSISTPLAHEAALATAVSVEQSVIPTIVAERSGSDHEPPRYITDTTRPESLAGRRSRLERQLSGQAPGLHGTQPVGGDRRSFNGGTDVDQERMSDRHTAYDGGPTWRPEAAAAEAAAAEEAGRSWPSALNRRGRTCSHGQALEADRSNGLEP